MYKLSKARILHFDCENRPLSYWYEGKCTAEVTAIAWSWADEKKIHCALLDREGGFDGGAEFLDELAKADMVTGHYIRRHDLPLLNGNMLEEGFKLLLPKLSSDTRLDLPRALDLPLSQEALSAYLGVKAPKIQMTQADWRDANRLTDTGLERTYRRVVADVKQHKEMRRKLIERGLLKPAKMWTP